LKHIEDLNKRIIEEIARKVGCLPQIGFRLILKIRMKNQIRLFGDKIFSGPETANTANFYSLVPDM
jgi:hypothetical protein